MQDENTVGAQHGPNMHRPSALVKNKSEAAPDGMPPFKSQKLTHTPSPQLQEKILGALQPVDVNVQQRKLQSRSIPGLGPKSKGGNDGQDTEKKQYAKSYSAVPTEKASGKLVQTTLSLERKASKDIIGDETATHDDIATAQALQQELDVLKQTVEDLRTTAAQQKENFNQKRQEVLKEQDVLAAEIQDLKVGHETLVALVVDQQTEISSDEASIAQLEDLCYAKAAEVLELRENLATFEDETAKELMASELQDEIAEVQALKEMIEETMLELSGHLEQFEDLELTLDPLAVKDLQRELQRKDDYILELETQLENSEGADLERTLGLPIGMEFEALKVRFSLTPGSSLEKELSKCQNQLCIKYDRQCASMRQQHTVKMQQVTIKTRSHETRLQQLQDDIGNAKTAIARSEDDFKAAEQERQQVRLDTQQILHEIEAIQQLIAAL